MTFTALDINIEYIYQLLVLGEVILIFVFDVEGDSDGSVACLDSPT
jgi:hypothetical protein